MATTELLHPHNPNPELAFRDLSIEELAPVFISTLENIGMKPITVTDLPMVVDGGIKDYRYHGLNTPPSRQPAYAVEYPGDKVMDWFLTGPEKKDIEEHNLAAVYFKREDSITGISIYMRVRQRPNIYNKEDKWKAMWSLQMETLVDLDENWRHITSDMAQELVTPQTKKDEIRDKEKRVGVISRKDIDYNPQDVRSPIYIDGKLLYSEYVVVARSEYPFSVSSKPEVSKAIADVLAKSVILDTQHISNQLQVTQPEVVLFPEPPTVLTVSSNEGELIGRVIQGDDEAFQVLYERHYDTVFSTIAALADVETAEELTTDAFTDVWRTLMRQGAGYSITNFRAYIREAARNVLYQSRRKKNKDLPHFSLDKSRDYALRDEQYEESRIKFPIDFSQVDSLLSQLEGRKSQIIGMHYLEGKKYQEIASILGSTKGAVKVEAMRAMNQLREWLGVKKETPLLAGEEAFTYQDIGNLLGIHRDAGRKIGKIAKSLNIGAQWQFLLDSSNRKRLMHVFTREDMEKIQEEYSKRKNK